MKKIKFDINKFSDEELRNIRKDINNLLNVKDGKSEEDRVATLVKKAKSSNFLMIKSKDYDFYNEFVWYRNFYEEEEEGCNYIDYMIDPFITLKLDSKKLKYLFVNETFHLYWNCIDDIKPITKKEFTEIYNKKVNFRNLSNVLKNE